MQVVGTVVVMVVVDTVASAVAVVVKATIDPEIGKGV